MTMKLAVIGYPLGQSKSPVIYNRWIERYGVDATYGPLEIAPDTFESRIRSMIDEGYGGFNITIPYKEKIIPLCAELDETARAIGAVNTVKITDGKLFGTNTDAYGFIQNLKEETGRTNFKGKAVVLGAGGAARAVVYALKQENFDEVLILNRTRERADVIAGDMNANAGDWEKCNELLADATLLVNTTSLGMTGQPPLDIDVSALPADATVYDIVYKPLMTDLLKDAESKGNQVVTGIGMLLNQAHPAFRLWTGIEPEVETALRDELLK